MDWTREPTRIRYLIAVALTLIGGLVDLVSNGLDAGDSFFVILAAALVFLGEGLRRVVTPVSDPRNDDGEPLLSYDEWADELDG